MAEIEPKTRNKKQEIGVAQLSMSTTEADSKLGLYSSGGATVPVKRDLRSMNFKDGVRGWRLRSNGDVDFPTLSVGGINQIDGGSSIGSFGSIAAVDGGDATTVF